MRRVPNNVVEQGKELPLLIAKQLGIADNVSEKNMRDFQTNGGYYTLYLDNFGEVVIACSEPILAMKADPIPRGVLHTVNAELQIQRTTLS